MKIGIALGGGGARGFAHLGVLKVLREAGIECDIVAGTSIGSLVGAVYAGGDLDGLEQATRAIRLTEIPLLLSPTLSYRGFFSGKNTLALLSEYIKISRIEDFPKPFAAVASDLKNCEVVVFTEGDVCEAVRASIAIPVIFTPVLSGDRVLVDGGTMEPVPVQICRQLGADIVIAVDLFGSYPPRKEFEEECKRNDAKVWPAGISSAMTYLNTIASKLHLGERFEMLERSGKPSPNFLDIVEGTLQVSQAHLTKCRLTEHPPDLLIQPAVCHVGLLDFHRGAPIIEIGVQAAREKLPELKSLIAQSTAALEPVEL